MGISAIGVRGGKIRGRQILGGGSFAALLALTFGAGMAQATVLSATSPTVTCNAITGPGAAANIVISPVSALSGATTIAVTVTAPGNGIVVTAPAAQTLNATTALTLSYAVNVAAACAGASSGPVSVHFNAAGIADVVATVTVIITSSLATSPSTIALYCVLSAGSYTPGPAVTEAVTSAVNNGTAFTVDNTGGTAPPAFVTLSSLAGGTATAAPVTFTVAPVCGTTAALGNVRTGTIYLDNAPAVQKLITVTLTILGPNPLVGTLSSPTMTYVKNSGNPGSITLALTSNPSGLFYSVNTATLPVWLTVNTTSGNAPSSVQFSSTSICDSLAPGTYTATVQLSVSGDGPLSKTISLLITNTPPTLSVSGSTAQNLSWTLGTPIPATSITLMSSDSPIAYTTATGGTLAPIIQTAQQSGLAYSFGTQIGITFNSLLFQTVSPGTVLTGTVTITSGSPVSTIVVTIAITVQSPGATLTGLTPSSVPTAVPGSTFTVTLTGSNFVNGASTLKTQVGIVAANGLSMAPDTNFSYTVLNPSNISLTITVPAQPDGTLPFAVGGAGGSVVIGVCNPGGTGCSIPTRQKSLTIAPGPIIQAVTSASSFTEAAPGASLTTSAYDILSVFGSNFCASGGTGCGSSTILSLPPDAVTERYPTALTPDTGASPRNLSVTFYVHGTGGALIATAPLLFATSSQINLLVPAAVSGHIGAGAVDLVVNFGSAVMPGTETAAATSAIYRLNIAAASPGVFTEGQDGQGNAAILSWPTYAPITQANPANMRSTAADSDVIMLYVTGLGAPDSTGLNTGAGGGTAPADCITPAEYDTALTASGGVTVSALDGAVIEASLIAATRFPPCMATTTGGASAITVPLVTIGGVAAAPATFAGFIDGSVAGLYQINFKLPSTVGTFQPPTGSTITNVTAAVALPVAITARGVTSQAGVNIWVQPQLKMTAPTSLSGTVGVPWAGSNNSVIASEGTGPYTYAVALTSAPLPAGLTLTSAGAITGIPAANTGGSYIVIVTASDSAAIPVTGSVTFTLSITADLYLTASPAGPFSGLVANLPISPVTTITATGGIPAYVYSIASVTPPNGGAASDITVNSSTGVVTAGGSAVAGVYTVVINVLDATAGTPLTGSITFTITLS
jgi:uncharacterized protein (TIGR03437 family)